MRQIGVHSILLCVSKQVAINSVMHNIRIMKENL